MSEPSTTLETVIIVVKDKGAGEYELQVYVGPCDDQGEPPQDATTLPLTQDSIMQWAMQSLRAAQYAETDAGMIRQYLAMGQDDATTEGVAALVLKRFREIRGERLDVDAVPGLVMLPGATRDCTPFIALELHGQVIGEWTTGQARGHALGLVEGRISAQLSTDCYRTLRDQFDLDDGQARFLVADLDEHMTRDVNIGGPTGDY